MTKSQNPPQPPRPRAPRTTSRYTRNETKRLLRCAIEAGLKVSGIEVDHVSGSMRILVDHPDAATAGKRA